MQKSSGPGPLVWVFTAVALVALAYFGWRSNQRPAVATPATAPAAAPQEPDQRQESAPVVTETNGGLAG